MRSLISPRAGNSSSEVTPGRLARGMLNREASLRNGLGVRVRTSMGNRRSPCACATPRSLEREQVLLEILLLAIGQAEAHRLVVVFDHCAQRRRAAVVEVRRVLPGTAQRRGAVHAGGAAPRLVGLHAGLGGGVQ